MINAYEELTTKLRAYNYTVDDIKAITVRYKQGTIINNAEELKHINYDEGFGEQELEGIVLLKDNNWFERAEYDGSEWWIYKYQITEKDVKNYFKDLT